MLRGRRRRLRLIATAAALPLFILTGTTTAASPESARIVEISLERTPCFGTCPVYRETVKSNGTVTYTGIGHVARLGTYIGRASPQAVTGLFAMPDQIGYSQLNGSYKSRATDQASTITSVSTRRARKTVTEYGHVGPAALHALQKTVDAAVATVTNWTKSAV